MAAPQNLARLVADVNIKVDVLVTVQNLLRLIGGPLMLEREDFPCCLAALHIDVFLASQFPPAFGVAK